MREKAPREEILSQDNSILNSHERVTKAQEQNSLFTNVDAALHSIQSNKERNARLKGEMEIKSVLNCFP